MPVEESALRRLSDIGRREGRVTVEALARELPIDRMAPEEIAAVIERLEAAGVEVDVSDPSLLRDRAPRAARVYEGEKRGEGVVDMGSPAAPAVSAPGVKPSEGGWIGSERGGHHPHRVAPTWRVGGIELLPLAAVLAVAILLLILFA